MVSTLITRPTPAMDRIDGYTPFRVVRTVAFAVVIWVCVAHFIRYGGANGQFRGAAGMATYVATAVVTIPLNWIARIVAGMPARSMPLVAALPLRTVMAKTHSSLNGVFVALIFPIATPTTMTRSPCATYSGGCG